MQTASLNLSKDWYWANGSSWVKTTTQRN
jgi:hypothetical protein